MVDGSFCRGTRHRQGDRGRMPTWSASAACNAGRSRPAAKPASCGCLELLEDEVQRCMGLLRRQEFAELDKSYLHAAMPANAPECSAAFPLLQIEPYRY